MIKIITEFCVKLIRSSHFDYKLFAKYHDPSSSGSPVILLTRLLYYTRCQSRKTKFSQFIIQSNIYRILPKVNQVIYTLETIGMSNIMILAQGILQALCLQGSIYLQCIIRKRGITLQKQVRLRKKKKWFRLFFLLVQCIEFPDPISNGSWSDASITDRQTNRQARTICPLKFFAVGGVKWLETSHSLLSKERKFYQFHGRSVEQMRAFDDKWKIIFVNSP